MKKIIFTCLSSRLSPTLEFLEFQESIGKCYHMHCLCITGICLSSRDILFAGNITLFPSLLNGIPRKAYPKGYLVSDSTTPKVTYICNIDENSTTSGRVS